MHHHRFRSQLSLEQSPRSRQPQAVSNGFMLCPPALLPQGPGTQHVWQHIYRLAFEQAQAVVRPSVLERYLVTSWN
jgi:hypothetical protein